MSWYRYHIRDHPTLQTALEVNDLPPSPTTWIFTMLKEKCSMIDSEWDKNQKMYHMELKAPTICSGDDVHDLFTKIFFVQAEIKIILAKKFNNIRLSMMVLKVKLKFMYGKKNIDDMTNKLMKQKGNHIKHNDFYVDEFTTGTLQMEKEMKTPTICSGDDVHDLFTNIFLVQAEIKIILAKKFNNLRLSTM
eukprot:7658454-Heterocapsa_arctica.AAC.1